MQTNVNKQQIMVKLDKAHNILQLHSSHGLLLDSRPGGLIPEDETPVLTE